MRILVYDIPAESGGALSVLKDFFDYVQSAGSDHEWFFLVSSREISSNRKNIRIILQEWAKKSILHRVCWEIFKAPGIAKSLKPDLILSFQNTPVLFAKAPVVSYIHQSVPFLEDRKFSFFKKEERAIAVYRSIFGTLIKSAVKKAKGILVQTHWMKRAIIQKYSIDENRVIVIPPAIKFDPGFLPKECKIDYNSFFYPCSPYVYKNIEIVIHVVRKMIQKGKKPYVYLTMTGEENAYAMRIKRLSKELRQHIIFLGPLPREKVFQMYKQHVLLFPSYLETMGLPLLEARTCNAPIIASDRPFSREILQDYKEAVFFNPFSDGDLEEKMTAMMNRTSGDTLVPRMDNDKTAGKEYDIDDSWGKLLEWMDTISYTEETH